METWVPVPINSDKCDLKGGYDNTIFKELSIINGEINNMHLSDIRGKLVELNLDPRGKQDVIKKRLKCHIKRDKLNEANIEMSNLKNVYNYFVVVDFEATCDEVQSTNFRQEIIEFPAVLICTNSGEVKGEFHSYVRPVLQPKLTSFCTELTGITQTQVDESPLFQDVLNKFERWMTENKLFENKNVFALVTDGPWDMAHFLYTQCEISDIKYPKWAQKWINLRKTYSNFYQSKRLCLREMLDHLGIEFIGQQHSGIDDARNIARIMQILLRDGAVPRQNEMFTGSGRPVSKKGLRVKNMHKLGNKKDACNNQYNNRLNARHSVSNAKQKSSPPINIHSNTEFPELSFSNFQI